MSFRHKKEKAAAKAKKEEDVKVVHAKDSKKDQDQDTSSVDQAAQQTTGQQSGQESGEPPGQTDEQTDEQQASGEEDDKDDDAEPVPDGTTAEILKWVGDDPERAQRALDKEQADDRPRTGLTGELKRILEQ